MEKKFSYKPKGFREDVRVIAVDWRVAFQRKEDQIAYMIKNKKNQRKKKKRKKNQRDPGDSEEGWGNGSAM